MIKLRSHETLLIGRWLKRDGQIIGDEVAERIRWLTSQVLQKIGVSSRWGAWETLFRDPEDGRYWEQTYPEGHLQGGGPPTLKWLLPEEANAKYEFTRLNEDRR
jgi:hypothetical protein